MAQERSMGPAAIAARSGRRSLHLENDGHRPVVDEVDGHPRAEYPRRDLDAEVAQLSAEYLVERLSLVGRRGLREARPVPLRRVGEQREVRDDERSAAGVAQRAVELPLLVLEDAQVGDLGGESFRVGGGVAARDPEQYAHAGADLAAGRDRGPVHPLDDRSQLSRSMTREAYVSLPGRSECASL